MNVALEALAGQVAPLGLARERTFPVDEHLADLFVERGLVRGQVLACQGAGATTVALSLAARAVADGSWLAVVDLPTLGLDAAVELGVPLERVVRVDTVDAARWADVVAAAADGFEVIIARVPGAAAATPLRKLAGRIRQRGAALLVVGDPGAMTCDGVVTGDAVEWSGLGAGWGRLRSRQLVVEASGRRLPGRRQCRLAR